MYHCAFSKVSKQRSGEEQITKALDRTYPSKTQTTLHLMLGRGRNSVRVLRRAHNAYVRLGRASPSPTHTPQSELHSSVAGPAALSAPLRPVHTVPLARISSTAAVPSFCLSNSPAFPSTTSFSSRHVEGSSNSGSDGGSGNTGSRSRSSSGAGSTAFAGAFGALLAVLAAAATAAAAPALDEESIQSILGHLLARPEKPEWRPEATEPVTGVRFPQVCEAFVGPDEMMRMRLIGTGIRYVFYTHLHSHMHMFMLPLQPLIVLFSPRPFTLTLFSPPFPAVRWVA